MSYDRYLLIHKFFHLSDNSKDDKSDLLFKIRPLLDLANLSFRKYNIPGKCVTIDETMIKYKGRIHFRQYISNKPVRFGVKCYLICNSSNGYCYEITVYTGKGTTPKIPHMTPTESIVVKMMEPYLNKFRILFVDNFYNSVKLSKYFLAKKTGLIGTLRKNRNKSVTKIEFPKNKGFDIYMNKPDYDLCMICAKDMKEFILTTNVNFPKRLNKKHKGNKMKETLSVLEEYIFKSKGVDLCNQESTQYRNNHPSKKWWRPVCFHFIQVMIFNSFIIFKSFNQSLSYKQYYKSLISSLLGEEKKKVSSCKNFHPIEFIDKDCKSAKRLSCKICKKLTMWKCDKCSTHRDIVSLCLPGCFNTYHYNNS